MGKERKTLNVSFQSRKYLHDINEILNEWDEEGLNLSTQICDNILLVHQIKQSMTFGSVLAVYELIERMMKVYHIEDSSQLERIFSEVVQVDNRRLSQLLSEINKKPSSSEDYSYQEPVESRPIIREIVKNPEPIQEENKTVVEETESDPYDIPEDFLFNS